MSRICTACGAENPEALQIDAVQERCCACGNYLIPVQIKFPRILGKPKGFKLWFTIVLLTMVSSILTLGFIPGFLLQFLVYPVFLIIGKTPVGETGLGLMIYGTIFWAPSLLLAYIVPYSIRPQKMDFFAVQLLSFAIIPYCWLVAVYLFLILR